MRIFAAALAAALAAGRAAAPAARADEADDWGSPQLQQRVDLATDKALAFLAKMQRKDGAWPARGRECAAGSLTILAFLAKGHMPGEQPYGAALDRGIDYVVSRQKPNGLLAGSGVMYAHGISTVMLSEVLGQTTGKRQEQVRAALARAVKLILDAQKAPKPDRLAGGWRYQPTSTDSDLSVTGWQLMALRAARNAGAEVPTEAIERAVAYVKRSACPGGGFAYQPGGPPNHARSGTGILTLELCGQHHAKEALAAGDWLLANPFKPFGHVNAYQYYTMYYCAQAMFQLGGKYWRNFWPPFAEAILSRQQPDGSWPLGSGGEAAAGPAYGASMAVLSLAVPYRLLPIYQR